MGAQEGIEGRQRRGRGELVDIVQDQRDPNRQESSACTLSATNAGLGVKVVPTTRCGRAHAVHCPAALPGRPAAR